MRTTTTGALLLAGACGGSGATVDTGLASGSSETSTVGTGASTADGPTTAAAASSGGASSDTAVDTTAADTTGGDDAGTPVSESPWGTATSHSSSFSLASWAPTIAATGIDWLRGFDQSQIEASLDAAEASGMQVSGILLSGSTFPVDDLPGWEAYVADVVGAAAGRVHHWEVWNEPPNFSDDKSPTSYATIVQSAYATAKAVDPTVQIGLAAQSNNVNFLDQALVAGAAGNFDYVTVHPYEILDLVDVGWEAEYMSIVPTLRKMLAARDPAHADAPIWFTEIGEPVDGDHPAAHQAGTVVKAYTMAIAQGVTRVHWFEGIDGDSGPFGLLEGDGTPRKSYAAMTTLIEQLGGLPTYEGWVLLEQRHYGFVFTGPNGPVLVAWAQPNEGFDLVFSAPVSAIDPITGDAFDTMDFPLGPAPKLFVGIPDDLLSQARANRDAPFPWGGDYSDASAVEYTAAEGPDGLHPVALLQVTTIDGQPVFDAGNAASLAFTVDPNFSSYDAVAIEIEAVLRRNGADSAGFNLKYESSQGWVSTGAWYEVPGDDQWYTKTWVVTDDQFVGKWGFNFAFDSDSTMFSQYSVQRVTVTKM